MQEYNMDVQTHQLLIATYKLFKEIYYEWINFVQINNIQFNVEDEFNRCFTGINAYMDAANLLTHRPLDSFACNILIIFEECQRLYDDNNFLKDPKIKPIALQINDNMDRLQNIISAKQFNNNKYECCDQKMQQISFGYQCIECGNQYQCYEETESLAKNKNNEYDPQRNFQEWITKITQVNVETDKEQEEDIQKILSYLKSQNPMFVPENGMNISMQQIKQLIKELKIRTKLSMQYIKYRITGIGPPELTDEQISQIEIYYMKIIKIIARIEDTRYNIPYCPEIISKIIQHIYDSNDEIQSICNFINYQSDEAKRNFDDMWRHVCKELPELTKKYKR